MQQNVNRERQTGWLSCSAVAVVLLGVGLIGCGGSATVLNPAFINSVAGGVFPLTPGPTAGFIMAWVQNDTDQNVDFFVTVEKEVPKVDDSGVFILDGNGNFVLETVPLETVLLQTAPAGQSRTVGVLFPCRSQRITRIGLGENLLPSDAAVLVGGDGTAAAPGTRVTVGNLNPLSFEDNNYDCGDTIIFQAFRLSGVPGNVGLQTFLLPGSEQPSPVSGPDTFASYEEFLESQEREDE